MTDPIRTSWRRWRDHWQDRRARRHFQRSTADLPDHLLKDVGLERDRTGRLVLDHILRTGT